MAIFIAAAELDAGGRRERPESWLNWTRCPTNWAMRP